MKVPDGFAVHCVFPEGDENFVRSGPVPGEGPVMRFPSREETQKTISFMKMGLEEGEDYESLSVVPWRFVASDPDLTEEEKRGVEFSGGYP